MSNDQLVIAALGIMTTLVGAYAVHLKAQARVSVNESEREKVETEREKLETETDSYVTKRITDNLTETTSENRDLQKQLRECEVSKATEIASRDAQIKELQRMVHDIGEREDQKNKLLAQLGPRLKASEDLNSAQENKIRELELLLDDCRSKN